MIRFVYIGDQIMDDAHDFAWYDTVCDRFIEYGDQAVWESWEEFEKDYSTYPDDSLPKLERFRRLFPDVILLQSNVRHITHIDSNTE